MRGKLIPCTPPPGMGLSSLTVQKGHPHLATPTPRPSRSLPPPIFTCPVCSGLKSSLDQNCPPCHTWATRLFTRLSPSGTVLVYHPSRTYVMES